MARLRAGRSCCAYVLTLAFGILLAPLRGNLENLVFDQYQRWRPRPYDFDQPVRIVDIDDESIHLIGRWPWPRQTMADLVDALAKADVAAIGFDFLFSEKERPSGDMKACAQGAAARRSGGALRGTRRRRRRLRPRDRRPSGRARHLPHPDPQRLAGKPHAEGGLFLRRRSADAVPQPASTARSSPIPVLADAAAGLGFLNWLPDNDRVVRRVPLLLDINGQIQPSLALETLRVAQGASGYVVKSTDDYGQHGRQEHGGRGDQGRRRRHSDSGGRRTARLVRQVRPAPFDPGLESPSARRRPLRSRGQARLRRRERLVAFGHRRDAARSVDAGGRSACATDRTDSRRA